MTENRKFIQPPEKIKVPLKDNGPEVQKLVDSGDRSALIDYNIKRMAPLLDALREYDSRS